MDELSNLLIGIPESVANLQLPDPQLRQQYLDERDRIFWVDDQIDATLLDLVKTIIRCNKEDKDIPIDERRPLRVFLDSPGGDVQALWTTIKSIEISKTPIWTINYCICYSAACDLFIAGHKRFALPGTNFLLHNGSCSFGGQVDTVASTKKYFDGLSKKLVDNVIKRTKIDPKVYKKKAITDWYFDEIEAVEIGVADKIVESFEEIF